MDGLEHFSGWCVGLFVRGSLCMYTIRALVRKWSGDLMFVNAPSCWEIMTFLNDLNLDENTDLILVYSQSKCYVGNKRSDLRVRTMWVPQRLKSTFAEALYSSLSKDVFAHFKDAENLFLHIQLGVNHSSNDGKVNWNANFLLIINDGLTLHFLDLITLDKKATNDRNVVQCPIGKNTAIPTRQNKSILNEAGRKIFSRWDG